MPVKCFCIVSHLKLCWGRHGLSITVKVIPLFLRPYVIICQVVLKIVNVCLILFRDYVWKAAASAALPIKKPRKSSSLRSFPVILQEKKYKPNCNYNRLICNSFKRYYLIWKPAAIILISLQIFDYRFIRTSLSVFGKAIRIPAGAELLLPPLIWLDLHPVHMFTRGTLKPAAPQPAANWFPAACGWEQSSTWQMCNIWRPGNILGPLTVD